jgi:hypothetical protein
MTEGVVVFVLRLPEAELLYECLTELAEGKLDAAEDEHDEKLARALDHIAEQIHTGLYGRGGR